MARKRQAELWGPGELCDAFGVARITLKRWRELRDFPRPVASLSIGDVWNAAEVRAWHRKRQLASRRSTP